MDAVLFGAGQGCKAMLPFLEKQYRILYIIDNNKELWGTTLGEYEIRSVNNIENNEGCIVITSQKYVLEIVNQLLFLKVNEDRIYFCHALKLYPLNPEKIYCRDTSLEQYDVLHQPEADMSHKKVFIICKDYSVYTKQLIENMAQRYEDIEFGLLTNAEEYKEKINTPHLKHIYVFQSNMDIRIILEKLPVYDVIQVLWMECEWSYFYHLIRKKARRLNLNIGGSDFYRAGQTQRDFLRRLIASADCIIGQTKGIVREFSAYYKQDAEGKMCLLPYGIEVLDWINRTENISKEKLRIQYGIPQKRIVVTCGHNASMAHQHIEILKALEKLPEHIKEDIICVFPMTYPKGSDRYIENIRTLLDASNLEYKILTEFMDFQSMAEYALISDIMIHVQTTDQLSSTMLEEMYTGSIIIAGKWLPYESLHEMGLYFLDIDKISDLTDLMKNVVMNMNEYRQKCKGNSEIVWKHSSWDELASKWYALWG